MKQAAFDGFFPPEENPTRPIAAFALSLVAGILMLIDGAIVLWLASAVSSVISGPTAQAASNFIGLLGILAVLFGLIMSLLAFSLFRNPDSHVGYGVTILVFSFVSFLVGGGFIVGAVLGIIGGILAIIFVPDDGELPIPPLGSERSPMEQPVALHRSVSPASRATAAGNRPRPPTTATSDSPERPYIGCPSCGEIQPTTNAIRCRKCGEPLRPG